MNMPVEKHQRFRELARRVIGHQSTAQIARMLDRTPATIRKWMRDPEFQEILKKLDEQVWAHVMEELSEQASESIFMRAEQDMDNAYSVLNEIMDDTTVKKELRHRCAMDILKLGGAERKAEQVQDKKIAMSTFHLNIFGETIKQVHGTNDGEAPIVITDNRGAKSDA